MFHLDILKMTLMVISIFYECYSQARNSHQMCSVNKGVLDLKILQISLENTCVGMSF